MSFSDYLKAMYGTKKQKNLTRISSQGWFVKALLFNAGSSEYADDKKPTYHTDETEQKMFRGERAITDKLRNSFAKGIDMEKLCTFFDKVISDSALVRVMNNFGIVNDSQPDRKLFFDALCIQFRNIITDPKDDVDNIVRHEYLRLMEEKANTVGVLKYINDKHKSDLESLQELLPMLNELSDTMEKHPFTFGSVYPYEIIEKIETVEQLLKDKSFFSPDLSTAVRAFDESQKDFTYCLSIYTFIVDEFKMGNIYTKFAAPGMTIEDKGERLHDMKKSMQSQITKILDVDKEIKQNLLDWAKTLK